MSESDHFSCRNNPTKRTQVKTKQKLKSRLKERKKNSHNPLERDWFLVLNRKGECLKEEKKKKRESRKKDTTEAGGQTQTPLKENSI